MCGIARRSAVSESSGEVRREGEEEEMDSDKKCSLAG